jgi:hypothetical protein
LSAEIAAPLFDRPQLEGTELPADEWNALRQRFNAGAVAIKGKVSASIRHDWRHPELPEQGIGDRGIHENRFRLISRRDGIAIDLSALDAVELISWSG